LERLIQFHHDTAGCLLDVKKNSVLKTAFFVEKKALGWGNHCGDAQAPSSVCHKIKNSKVTCRAGNLTFSP
jgi:hypothetical protein